MLGYGGYQPTRSRDESDYRPRKEVAAKESPRDIVKRLSNTIARLEYRSECLEERIAELEDVVARLAIRNYEEQPDA